MCIYIVTFLLVVLISYFAEKLSNKNKVLSIFFIFVAIVLLSFVGGMRDYNIGTDINVYGKNWFEYALKYQKFANYADVIETSDIGYLFINFWVAKFTENFNTFLFIHQLICNSLIFITLYKYRKEVPLYLSVLVYLCVYYCRTYNYLRQSLALSIVFFGFRYVKEKKIIKFLAVVLIAAQFHFTAYVALTIYIIYMLLSSDIKYKNIFTILIIALTIFCTVNIVNVIKILYSCNIVSYRIYQYIYNSMRGSIDISIIETAFKLVFLGICLIGVKKINEKEKMNLAIIVMLIMDFIFFQMRSVILYTDRFSLYYGYMLMLLFPQIPQIWKKNNDSEIIKLVIILVLIIFWLFKFVFENSGEVFPYTSNILGI